MKNHGVLVVGDTVAEAYRRLYMLERVCRAQVLAMSTGRELEMHALTRSSRKVQTPMQTTVTRAPSASACTSTR